MRIERNRLLLAASVAGEGVLDGLGGIAEGLLGGREDALALVGGIVAARSGGVTDLLGRGLVALCEGC